MRSRILFHCYVLGSILGTLLIAPAWGTDDPDSHHPPLFKQGYPVLDIGFKGFAWAESHNIKSCTGPCLSRTAVVSQVVPDKGLSYEQDFSLNLGQTGPVSFRFSGRRLKMEVAF